MILLNRNNVPINYSDNGYPRCPYCIKLKGRSKRFRTIFALTWHCTHEHQNEIGVIDVSDVSVVKSSMIKREIPEID